MILYQYRRPSRCLSGTYVYRRIHVRVSKDVVFNEAPLKSKTETKDVNSVIKDAEFVLEDARLYLKRMKEKGKAQQPEKRAPKSSFDEDGGHIN